jgi:hypothetical protein
MTEKEGNVYPLPVGKNDWRTSFPTVRESTQQPRQASCIPALTVVFSSMFLAGFSFGLLVGRINGRS